tara:strand:- start:2540 stop:2902 length:363 start_codon:yes stop_codon:yes gene_type:complete
LHEEALSVESVVLGFRKCFGASTACLIVHVKREVFSERVEIRGKIAVTEPRTSYDDKKAWSFAHGFELDKALIGFKMEGDGCVHERLLSSKHRNGHTLFCFGRGINERGRGRREGLDYFC